MTLGRAVDLFLAAKTLEWEETSAFRRRSLRS
jgi:hypothetical protein